MLLRGAGRDRGPGLLPVESLNPVEELPEGFAKSNGRIEATEIDVATKIAGRILDELVDEGNFVTAGQVVAHMDIESLQAQRREAVAKLGMAKSAVDTARSTLAQRESEKAAAQSVVAQARPNMDLATNNLARGQELVKTGAMSKEDVDTRRAVPRQRQGGRRFRESERGGSGCCNRHGQIAHHRSRGKCRIRPGDDRTNPS